MDAAGAVGARRKYREAPTPNEAGGGTCMLRRAMIPLTCVFYCRVYGTVSRTSQPIETMT